MILLALGYFVFALLVLGGASSMVLCLKNHIPYFWRGLLIDTLAMVIGIWGIIGLVMMK